MLKSLKIKQKNDAKFNEEIDEIGYHNNTVTVDEFTQFGPDFSKAY